MSDSDSETSACQVCTTFEPQAWRKSLCRNCFHVLDEHSEDIIAAEGESFSREKAAGKVGPPVSAKKEPPKTLPRPSREATPAPTLGPKGTLKDKDSKEKFETGKIGSKDILAKKSSFGKDKNDRKDGLEDNSRTFGKRQTSLEDSKPSSNEFSSTSQKSKLKDAASAMEAKLSNIQPGKSEPKAKEIRIPGAAGSKLSDKLSAFGDKAGTDKIPSSKQESKSSKPQETKDDKTSTKDASSKVLGTASKFGKSSSTKNESLNKVENDVKEEEKKTPLGKAKAKAAMFEKDSASTTVEKDATKDAKSQSKFGAKVNDRIKEQKEKTSSGDKNAPSSTASSDKETKDVKENKLGGIASKFEKSSIGEDKTKKSLVKDKDKEEKSTTNLKTPGKLKGTDSGNQTPSSSATTSPASSARSSPSSNVSENKSRTVANFGSSTREQEIAEPAKTNITEKSAGKIAKISGKFGDPVSGKTEGACAEIAGGGVDGVSGRGGISGNKESKGKASDVSGKYQSNTAISSKDTTSSVLSDTKKGDTKDKSSPVTQANSKQLKEESETRGKQTPPSTTEVGAKPLSSPSKSQSQSPEGSVKSSPSVSPCKISSPTIEKPKDLKLDLSAGSDSKKVSPLEKFKSFDEKSGDKQSPSSPLKSPFSPLARQLKRDESPKEKEKGSSSGSSSPQSAAVQRKDSDWDKLAHELKVKEDLVTILTKQLAGMEDQIKQLEEDKEQIRKDAMKAQKDDVEKSLKDVREHLAKMESQCSKLQSDNQTLIDKLHAQEASVKRDQNVRGKNTDNTILEEDLEAAEQELEDLKDINKELECQIMEMKNEMDEMYDHFRENEHDEFRELQKELDMTAKNCRILQFKLRKAERRNEQIEEDRIHYEEKLRHLQDQFDSQDAKNHIRVLEEELRIAKEVSVRLHDELDIVEDKRNKALEENRHLTELLEHTDKRQFRMEMEIDKLRDMVQDLKQQLKRAKSGDNNESKDSSPDRRYYVFRERSL